MTHSRSCFPALGAILAVSSGPLPADSGSPVADHWSPFSMEDHWSTFGDGGKESLLCLSKQFFRSQLEWWMERKEECRWVEERLRKPDRNVARMLLGLFVLSAGSTGNRTLFSGVQKLSPLESERAASDAIPRVRVRRDIAVLQTIEICL